MGNQKPARWLVIVAAITFPIFLLAETGSLTLVAVVVGAIAFHCSSKLSIEQCGRIEMPEVWGIDEFNCPMVQVSRQCELDSELKLRAPCRENAPHRIRIGLRQQLGQRLGTLLILKRRRYLVDQRHLQRLWSRANAARQG